MSVPALFSRGSAGEGAGRRPREGCAHPGWKRSGSGTAAHAGGKAGGENRRFLAGVTAWDEVQAALPCAGPGKHGENRLREAGHSLKA